MLPSRTIGNFFRQISGTKAYSKWIAREELLEPTIGITKNPTKQIEQTERRLRKFRAEASKKQPCNNHL
jgi:hypothetical protein